MKIFRLLVLGLTCLASVACSQSASAPPQQFADLGDLKLESGATIHECKLGYRTFGTMNADKSNVVLYPSWFSGNSQDLAGTLSSTGFVDPSMYFFVLVDALGNGISCSPSNSATQHGIEFPRYTIRDMVESEQRLVTEKFGLTHVHAVMGMSMGGMQTFQWVVSYPQFMDVAIPIVGSPKLTSYDMMLWRTEEQAMLAEPAYAGGRYAGNPKMPTVQLIHNLNLTTPEFRVKTTSPAGFESFFEETEKQRNGAFDANDWRWQMHAMMALDVGKETSLEVAAAKVKARVLVISSRHDHMVNPIPAIQFAPLIHAKLLILEGDCGHIAPGCEANTVRPAIAAALK